MMEANKHVYGENMELLKEIYTLKVKLNDLYIQNGPNNSDYIDLSIKLDVLEKKYMEEKLTMYHNNFVNMGKPQKSGQDRGREKMGGQVRKSLVWHALLQR